MSGNDVYVLAGVGVIALLIVYQTYLMRKKTREHEKAIAALWALDYHNPNSPKYDPERIKAENTIDGIDLSALNVGVLDNRSIGG